MYEKNENLLSAGNFPCILCNILNCLRYFLPNCRKDLTKKKYRKQAIRDIDLASSNNYEGWARPVPGGS